MLSQDGETLVGRTRGALQRRFPWPLAFVAGLFYILAIAGDWTYGASAVERHAASFALSLSVNTSARLGQFHNAPLGCDCREAGSRRELGANRDPARLARSDVVRDNRNA